MGWNTWCTLGPCGRDYCDANEIKAIGSAIHSSGMFDLVYNYVNLDDCWAGKRDKNGEIHPEELQFPHVMKNLADYLHDIHLKFGLYTDAGTLTCKGKRPGSYGYYKQDAATYASWGMDFVKMDWCNTKINQTQLDPRVQYPQMRDALNVTGRPIFFSACEWGADNPWEWGMATANSWRISGDHHDNWGSTASIIEYYAGKAKYSGPGGWNDPDFIYTGGQGCFIDHRKRCPGQTETEYITEFSMWALWSAPLIVATEIRNMTDFMKSVLLNKEIIAINQDKLAIPGDRIGFWPCSEGDHICQLWTKQLAGGDYALLLYNAGKKSNSITFDFKLIGKQGQTLHLRDLWTHSDIGAISNNYTTTIPSHGIKLVRASTARL